ncbi:MAG TPA: hypothetical protein VFX28_23990, partial [Methylomirabilota bacterium]|nr:hypothetical protein [Methylomirabilota bacterium]
RSILVQCTPGGPGPGAPPGGGAAPGAGTPTGVIRPPDTGTGLVDVDGHGALSWWPIAALAAAAVAMAGVRLALRRA